MKKAYSKRYQVCISALLWGLREKKGLCQYRVFQQSGVDVSKYESGACFPKATSIKRLCEFYGIRFAGFWAVCDEFEAGSIGLEKAIRILDQWGQYDHVFQVAIGVFTQLTKAI